MTKGSGNLQAATARMESFLAGLYGLLRGPFWNREKLLSYQLRRLRLLVQYSFRSVPFYRNLYQSRRIAPEDIQTLEDIGRLPVTTRHDLQSFPEEDLWSQGIRRGTVVDKSTGGSTGEPLRVKRTKAEEWLLSAFRMRSLLFYGLLPGQRMASVHFLPETSRPYGRPRFPAQFFFPCLEIHCHLDPEKIGRLVAEARPRVLGGLPEVLHRVSEKMNEEELKKVRPLFLITGAEILNPETRHHLSSRFKAPVYDRYSAAECRLVASSCPRNESLYHICEESVLAEVTREGRPAAPGEEGEILITSLHSYSMPFIRYKLGDLVCLGKAPCSCGAPYRTLSAIRGRILDRFIRPDGSEIHVSAIDQSLREAAPWIRRYCVVQKKSGLILIEAVAGEHPGGEKVIKAAQRVSEKIEGMPVSIELKEALPLAESGKFRLYRSELSERSGGGIPHSQGIRAD